MASVGNEGEKPPMIPKEVMDVLSMMKFIVAYLYQRVQRAGEGELLVYAEGGGEGGGYSRPSSPYTDGENEYYSKNKHTKILFILMKCIY